MAYTCVLTRQTGRVLTVQINRPDKLNALNATVMEEVCQALEAGDADASVGCMVLTGDARAFAAGADIGEMAEATPVEMLERNNIARWDRLRKVAKPIVAAVSGYALGGGCELALACDMIVAAESAQFGQPEIGLGVIPGAGGTQRLTRQIGKYLAMEMVLTGRYLGAREAERYGLVSRVVPTELYLEEAEKLAADIVSRAPIAVRIGKECVLKACETSLPEGLDYERRMFYWLFSTDDQKEGMRAFVEKRKPSWSGK